MTPAVRQRLLRQFSIVVTVLALVAVVVPLSSPAPIVAAAASSRKTVTGTDHAWDAVNLTPLAAFPTATVSQTTGLVDQTVEVSWTGLTPSHDTTVADTGLPVEPQPSLSPGSTMYSVRVLQCKGANPKSYDDCYSAPAGATFGSSGLGNAVDTVTFPGPHGTSHGSASLHVETAANNTLLGCDVKHACSVVVLPAWGGVQPDDTSMPVHCDDHTQDFPNTANGFTNDYALDIHISSRCNWAHRLVIPLSFAPTDADCPSSNPAFAAAGSPMLDRAMSQWQSGWCRDHVRLTLTDNSTNNEYQARQAFLAQQGALTSATDVAFTTQPAASAQGQKFTYAPLANTDIAIAFVIDDPSTGNIVQNITLDARLVAKLLTQSYAPLNFSCSSGATKKQSATCDPAVQGNPQSLLSDPEFRALNPTLKDADLPVVGEDAIGGFFPIVVSGNSDLTWELTRWIASDAQARAFLKGAKDKWGMHVNTYYKGITYPTSQLQELDPGYVDPTAPPGNGTMQNAWQPVSGLDQVGVLLAGNTSTALGSSPTCTGPQAAQVCKWPRATELAGSRDLFAILDGAQAAAYHFPVAHLVNADGTAVAPTPAAIRTTLRTMTTNADGVTQRVDHASRAAGNYPLTVVDYAMVRTCGLSAKLASSVALMLTKVGASQRVGVEPGLLALGFVGLDAKQRHQLASAQRAVAGQTGCPPPPPATHTTSPSQPVPTVPQQTPPAPPVTTQQVAPVVAPPSTTTPARTTAPPVSTTPATQASTTPPAVATTTTPATRPVAFVNPSPDSAGPTRFALPVLIGLAAVLLVAGAVGLLVGPAAGGTALGQFLRRRGGHQ